MSDTAQRESSGITSDYVKTQCRICAAGATISKQRGLKATFCLMLREWMTDREGNGKITGCDRWEAKDVTPPVA